MLPLPLKDNLRTYIIITVVVVVDGCSPDKIVDKSQKNLQWLTKKVSQLVEQQ